MYDFLSHLSTVWRIRLLIELTGKPLSRNQGVPLVTDYVTLAFQSGSEAGCQYLQIDDTRIRRGPYLDGKARPLRLPSLPADAYHIPLQLQNVKRELAAAALSGQATKNMKLTLNDMIGTSCRIRLDDTTVNRVPEFDSLTNMVLPDLHRPLPEESSSGFSGRRRRPLSGRCQGLIEVYLVFYYTFIDIGCIDWSAKMAHILNGVQSCLRIQESLEQGLVRSQTTDPRLPWACGDS